MLSVCDSSHKHTEIKAWLKSRLGSARFCVQARLADISSLSLYTRVLTARITAKSPDSPSARINALPAVPVHPVPGSEYELNMASIIKMLGTRRTTSSTASTCWLSRPWAEAMTLMPVSGNRGFRCCDSVRCHAGSPPVAILALLLLLREERGSDNAHAQSTEYYTTELTRV